MPAPPWVAVAWPSAATLQTLPSVPSQPGDEFFAEQWQFSAVAEGSINIGDIWLDYTGAGVKVAVFDTTTRGVVATYNDDFAADFGKNVRDIVKTPQHKQVFANFGLKRGGAASDRLETVQGGQWSFVGRGGSLTGRGGHILICDDLIKDDKEAQSQAIRDQAWNWFTKVAMSRRMGRKIVIMTFTRWHADDPIGRLTDPENPYFNEKLAKRVQ